MHQMTQKEKTPREFFTKTTSWSDNEKCPEKCQQSETYGKVRIFLPTFLTVFNLINLQHLIYGNNLFISSQRCAETMSYICTWCKLIIRSWRSELHLVRLRTMKDRNRRDFNDHHDIIRGSFNKFCINFHNFSSVNGSFLKIGMDIHMNVTYNWRKP